MQEMKGGGGKKEERISHRRCPETVDFLDYPNT